MSHYVGLDVSQDLTAVCVVDEHGTITHEGAVPTEPAVISALSLLFIHPAPSHGY